MKRLLAELEAARARQHGRPGDRGRARGRPGARPRHAADALAFNEAMTRRRLIDSQLVSAGWDVGADGAGTESVSQEFEVDHQPTPTGKGKADYVLWGDNGKPLAVIEAKKTAVDAGGRPDPGQVLRRRAGEGHGQRPVIFYTNGYDIWIWNDAQGEPPRKIYGFYSKDSLEYLHLPAHRTGSR